MFVDQIKVYARAGKGGDGSMHFHRGKFRPKGGPDGGDGGKGGDIILLVDSSTNSLRQYFFNAKLIAEDGHKGGGNMCSGISADEVIYKVPSGTVISKVIEEEDPETGEMVTRYEPYADLTEVGQRFTLCKGGKGGKGNVHFKTSTHQAPREFTPGEDGDEGYFHFELRSIADAGFVGFPNAGKSTMLSKLSAAKPKIANYPFTTLQPMVGVIHFGDHRRGTLADIPGLIEGAHQNIGLGHDFLRHIMRCRILLFVVDAAGTEGRDPVEDLETVRKEVSLYSKELSKRPWHILANKIDVEGAEENVERLKERFKRVRIFPVSAETGLGLDKLRDFLDKKIGQRFEVLK
ncbi:GTP-binding protein [Prosthecobacter fusiformis]|uniref:GTPase Obg n=1 Tax=Prosthecobacter fusiformis TaxID=48464 RepID=A0A4R7RKB5_9BACT|nr:GTPase ObgE [Prosthecobacter fusiformis]TDU64581.1 GTP-binding protein [Prosthecobacter fusiformis]